MREQMDGPAEKPRTGDDEREPDQKVATERPRLTVLDVEVVHDAPPQ
jgi:hypothetical protein